MLWGLYQLAMAALLALAGPVLLLLRGRHYLPTLPGRLGRYRGEVVGGALWLHAVSVGEVAVAAALVRGLPPELPLLVTTVTPTGQQRARALFGDRPATAVAYLPFELAFAVRRFFRRFSPRALVLVEGDLWPLVLRAARRRGLPTAVVNGRVSDATLGRLLRLRPLARRLYGAVDRWGVQSEQDRRRLAALGLGAERLSVTGNLKYESPEPPPLPALEERLAELAAGRPLLVAGSTMAGEEEQVAAAFAALGGGRRALLVIAPRHPERWDEAARLLERQGLVVRRRSRLDAGPAARPDVLLLDTLGELAGLYRYAAAAFIGGTLVPTGGHNPLEPARFAVATAVGPSMENFRDMAERFTAAGAWARVSGAEELAAAWRHWLDDPAEAAAVGGRAAALVEANRGALQRSLQLLAPLVEAVRRGGGR